MPAQIPRWWKCSSWWKRGGQCRKKSCWRQIWRVLNILRGERGGLGNQCSLLFPSCPPKKLCNSRLLNDLLAICHTLQTTMLQIKKRWSTKIWPVLHILRGGRGGLGKQCSLSLPYPEKLVFIFWLLNDLFIIFYYWWPFPFICKVHCCKLIRGFQHEKKVYGDKYGEPLAIFKSIFWWKPSLQYLTMLSPNSSTWHWVVGSSFCCSQAAFSNLL